MLARLSGERADQPCDFVARVSGVTATTTRTPGIITPSIVSSSNAARRSGSGGRAERREQAALPPGRRRTRQDRDGVRARHVHHARNPSSTLSASATICGSEDIGLDQPPEMHDAGDRRDVRQAMQRLPAAAQPPDHALGGRHRQRQQHQPRQHPDGDEAALGDVFEHPREVEELVEHDPREQVQRRVEEREQAEHAPQLDDLVPPGQAAQRRHRRA